MGTRVVLLRVGQPPEVTFIGEGYEEMQRAVGGLLDRMALDDRTDVWFHDEGLLEGKEPCLWMAIDEADRWHLSLVPQAGWGFIVGDCFLAGHDGHGNTVSLSSEDCRRWLSVLGIGG